MILLSWPRLPKKNSVVVNLIGFLAGGGVLYLIARTREMGNTFDNSDFDEVVRRLKQLHGNLLELPFKF